MYIFYDDDFKITGVSSSVMEGNYIELTKEEYRKIETELVNNFENYRVELGSNAVVFSDELEEKYNLKKREIRLSLNSKEIEISGLMIENEIIKKHLDIPVTFDKKIKWEERIKNNYVTDEQIEVLKELKLI